MQTVKVQFSHKKFLTREKFWDIIKAQRQCNVSQIHPLLSDPWQQGLLQAENMKRYTQTRSERPGAGRLPNARRGGKQWSVIHVSDSLKGSEGTIMSSNVQAKAAAVQHRKGLGLRIREHWQLYALLLDRKSVV